MKVIALYMFVLRFRMARVDRRGGNFSQPDTVLLSTMRNAAIGQLLVLPAAPVCFHSASIVLYSGLYRVLMISE